MSSLGIFSILLKSSGLIKDYWAASMVLYISLVKKSLRVWGRAIIITVDIKIVMMPITREICKNRGRSLIFFIVAHHITIAINSLYI